MCNTNAMGPSMVSAAKVIDNECSTFSIPVVEVVETLLCRKSYDILSLSQMIISTMSTSETLHENEDVEKLTCQKWGHLHKKTI